MGAIDPVVDPSLVPHRTLYTGARMPAIGLGTFGSDHVSAEEVAAAVRDAAAAGYRHFDCASVYGNEHRIGAALQDVIRGGIRPRASCGSRPNSGTTSTHPAT